MKVNSLPHALAVLPPGNNLGYELNRKLCGPHSQSGRFEVNKNLFLLLQFQSRIVQPVV
jgi:hypothetical protein